MKTAARVPIILRRAEVFSGTERSGDSLWYDLSITDVGNMGIFYAKAMSVFGKKYLERWKPDLIVPVPLHPRKKRMRGFNQAAYLAERLSVLTGIPWNGHLVKKIRSTRSQKKLNAIQRRQNLKNAYQVTERIPGFSVLVVDDVYTTGSTADAMAMCLLEAGAEKVYFLTICAGRA